MKITKKNLQDIIADLLTSSAPNYYATDKTRARSQKSPNF